MVKYSHVAFYLFLTSIFASVFIMPAYVEISHEEYSHLYYQTQHLDSKNNPVNKLVSDALKDGKIYRYELDDINKILSNYYSSRIVLELENE